MRVTNADKSAAASARRAQIVAATITVIAEEGYGRASFARIAKRAGLSSTRLISYHFAGKDELITAAANDVMSTIGTFMAEQMRDRHAAPARLHAYIEGIVGFIDSHRTQMKALMAILLGGGLNYDADTDRKVISPVEQILRDGQAAGEFGEFDPVIMAAVVQRAVDGLPFLLDSEPDLDCAHYARELVALFDAGTTRTLP
ncbi:TetR/AcrR family transcriptional regulator [Spelaeicoccus albus]